MDWLDLLAVQGTLKSLLQHHTSKASILQCSAFFTVQLSHPYMTTGKTIALTRQTFVGKVMSLHTKYMGKQWQTLSFWAPKLLQMVNELSWNFSPYYLFNYLLLFFSSPIFGFSSVQFRSVAQSCPTFCDCVHGLQHTRPTCPSSTLRIYSNSSPLSPVMPSNHLILWCPLLLPP